MEKLEQELFSNPEDGFRGMPFWSWNTQIKKEVIKKQISYFKEMGFGGYFVHVRTGLDTPYLKEEFLEDIAYTVEQGKHSFLKTGLYDEDRWPSGYAGGEVTKSAEYRASHILFTKYPYAEDERKIIKEYNPNFTIGIRSGTGRLLAAFDIELDDQGILRNYSCIRGQISLTAEKKENRWYAYVEENPSHSWYNNGSYTDVLNKKAIDRFIACTHEKYKEKVGDSFGEAITAIFTDEPHMTYRTSLSEPFSEEDQFLPWTKELPEEICEKYGVDIIENLPELIWQTGNEKGSEVRYYFGRILSDLFSEAYVENLEEWCSKNRLMLTGHFLYEETLFQQNRSDGDLMRMYRHMDIPGMDLLFDDIALTTAKQVQSIARQYHKPGVMSEEYGGTNWGFGFKKYISQGNWQAALGVTLRVPHLSAMSIAGEGKRDFPASIFYQAPWYKEWKQIEDHFARINYALSIGEPAVHLGVIHPIESYWILFGPDSQTEKVRQKLDNEFAELTEWLIYQNIDFDFIDEELLPELYDGKRNFGKMTYDLILLPDLLTIRKATFWNLGQYKSAGGKVIAAGRYPEMIDGIGSSQPGQLLCGDVIPFTKKDILQAAFDSRDYYIYDDGGENPENYICQMKETEDMRILFLCYARKVSAGCELKSETITIKMKGCHAVRVWDTMTGNVKDIGTQVQNGETTVMVNMYPYGSLLLEYTKQGAGCGGTALFPVKSGIWSKTDVPDAVEYLTEEPNVLLLDVAEYSREDGIFHQKNEILKIDQILRRQFEMPERGSAMVQPYRMENESPIHHIQLRYQIESTTECSDVQLASEFPESSGIFWNGMDIQNKPCGWYIDEQIKKVSLGNLKRGLNELLICVPFQNKTNLEQCYLLGNFGTAACESHSAVTERPEKISWRSLKDQGFAFYGGNVVYQMDVYCPDGKIRIQIPEFSGELVSIAIDGKREGSIILPPYLWEKHGLEKGIHKVELTLYGNRFNTLSHLHDIPPEPDKSRPSQWRTTGEKWTYEYVTAPFGVTVRPEIYI